jgi:hypothetical protein
MHRLLRLALLMPLLLAACAGPAEVREAPPRAPAAPETPEAPAAPVGYPAYETFDPSGYDAQPARQPTRTEVVHDAPAQLLAGTIQEVEEEVVGPRTVQGFRIQLFTSESKPSADAVRDSAVRWWRTVREDPAVREAFPYGMPSAVVFGRPFYRVRVGAFEDREQAQAALALLREQFPEAFLVPDTVVLGGE